MNKFFLIFSIIVGLYSSVSAQRQRVLIETTKGDIVVELYDETPRHRDNFLAKVREGKYDGMQFHRVINGFMIQGGNLLTRGLKYDDELPDDSISGLISAEFLPDKFIHTKGALAAARQGDEVNPKKESSASQFYIVTGKYHTDLDLDEMQAKLGRIYTDEQRKAYKLEGGAPHLDGGYTIFGRLVGGWKSVDKIQKVDTDEDDRPLKPITIKRMVILQPGVKK